MNSSDTTVGATGAASQFNNLRKDLRLAIKDIISDTDGTTIPFDCSGAAGVIHKVTLGGNRTFTVSGLTAGQSFVLLLKQDATGGRTISWFLSPGAGTPAIKWQNAIVPVLSTTPARTDIFAFFYDGTDIFGSIVGQNYG